MKKIFYVLIIFLISSSSFASSVFRNKLADNLVTSPQLIQICNNTKSPVTIAISYDYPDHDYVITKGWYFINAIDCIKPSIENFVLDNRIRLAFHSNTDEVILKSKITTEPETDVVFSNEAICIADAIDFDSLITRNPAGNVVSSSCVQKGFHIKLVDGFPVFPNSKFTINIGDPSAVPKINIGTIQDRCIFSYDDSQQFHSSSFQLNLDYQAAKVTMKKLHHCMKLTVTGPISIEGVANEFVNACVDKALNEDKNERIIGAIIALAADIFLDGDGEFIAARTAEYINGVSNSVVSCLTNTNEMEKFMSHKVETSFDAHVHGESNWVYWQL